MKKSTFCCFLTLFCSISDAFNILVTFNHPGKSHFMIYEPVFNGLLSRGHNVTVVSYNSLKTNHSNYRDVRLGDGREIKNSEVLSIDSFTRTSRFGWMSGIKILENYTLNCEKLYNSKTLQEFLKENNQYDLILTQYFVTDCFMGVIKKFNAPYIGE